MDGTGLERAARVLERCSRAVEAADRQRLGTVPGAIEIRQDLLARASDELRAVLAYLEQEADRIVLFEPRPELPKVPA